MSRRRSSLAEATAAKPMRGFGLLEAIVGLALLAGVGLALFAWINQSLQTAAALQQREREARLQLSALALLGQVNPAQSPEGNLSRGGIDIEWRAELIAPMVANATFSPPARGRLVVGLYRLQVKARDSAAGFERHFEQIRTGVRGAAASQSGDRQAPG